MKKPLICLLGGSGSGKSTLAHKLQRKYGYEQVRSYTTRPMRSEENDILTHTFITPNEVSQYKDDIVCDTVFNGFYYFATKSQLANAQIYVIDKEGLRQLKENYHEKQVVSIFLDVPTEIVAKRMEQRGDENEAIMQRLIHDNEAFNGVKEMCDFICDNSDNNKSNDICEFINYLYTYYNGDKYD